MQRLQLRRATWKSLGVRRAHGRVQKLPTIGTELVQVVLMVASRWPQLIAELC